MADAALFANYAAECWRFSMNSNVLPDQVKIDRNSGALRYDKKKLNALIKNATGQFQDSMQDRMSRSDMVRNGNGRITYNEFTALTRGVWASLFNDPRAHDIYEECGYPEYITPLMYRAMYDREGIPALVVDKWPEECWAQLPEIYESPDPLVDTLWEEEFGPFEKRTKLFHYMERIDKLSGIGSYGPFLIGIDDGKPLYMPADGIDLDTGDPIDLIEGEDFVPMRVNFYKAFDESESHVAKFNTDQYSPRHGHPELYLIRFNDPSTVPVGQFVNDITTHLVHWTRIVHIAEHRKSNEWFAIPRMQNVYNRLQDCRKILSGSGEMFWKGAFPGYAFETNPELMDPILDKESIREEFAEYSRGLQRYLAVSGVQVKTLGVQLGDPTPHYDTQIKSIAMAKSIPWRVFVGSEQSQATGEQDTAAWNKRVLRRCNQYLTPMLIMPIIDRLIALRCLRKPKEPLSVIWPDIDSATDSQKADNFLKWMQGLATFVGGDVERVCDPMSMWHIIAKFPKKIAEAIIANAKAHIANDVQIRPPEPVPAGPGGPSSKPKGTTAVNGGMR